MLSDSIVPEKNICLVTLLLRLQILCVAFCFEAVMLKVIPFKKKNFFTPQFVLRSMWFIARAAERINGPGSGRKINCKTSRRRTLFGVTGNEPNIIFVKIAIVANLRRWLLLLMAILILLKQM